MLYICLEDDVDDIVWKPQEVNKHLDDVRKVFLRSRQYNLRMNLLEYAFGLSSAKFLGFTVHRKCINLHPAKPKAIEDMEPPSPCKQMKLYAESVLYLLIHSGLSLAPQAVP